MKRISWWLLHLSVCAALGPLFMQPAMAQCAFPAPAPPPPPPACPVGGLVFGTPVAFGWGPPPVGCPAGINDALVGDLAVAWATKSVGASAIGCLVGEDDAVGPAAAADFSWNEGPGFPAYDRDVLLVGVCP